MATFTSSAEWNQFLSLYGPSLAVKLRIGFEAEPSSLTQWNWVTGEKGNFANWDANEPGRAQGHGEDSVVMSSASENFGWHDWFKTVSNFGYLLEFGYPTDPLKADTDGDRYNDNEETLAKTDPNDPSEYPGSRAPVIRDHPASLSVTSGGNATLSVAAVSPGANILTNTGFEGSTGGWFNFGGTIGLTNTAFTGSNAVRLTRGEGYARLRYSNSLTLTSGVSYLATAMVRDSFAPTGDEFEFWNDNIHGPVLVSVRYPPALTNNLAGGTNWVKVRQLFTATNSGSGSIMLVAWNLARGEGLTANFGEVVTGIQPLMTFVLAGVAWLVQLLGGGKFEFARAMILFGGLNALVFAALVARSARLALTAATAQALRRGLALLGIKAPERM